MGGLPVPDNGVFVHVPGKGHKRDISGALFDETLDAIENVDVSYTKDSGTPGEVLMYKDGVSFGQESESDIPLYISQQNLLFYQNYPPLNT